jgi:hypothetical protein
MMMEDFDRVKHPSLLHQGIKGVWLKQTLLSLTNVLMYHLEASPTFLENITLGWKSLIESNKLAYSIET